MTAVKLSPATLLRLPLTGFGTLPLDDPPSSRSSRLSGRLLPVLRFRRRQRVCPDRRRGPARRDRRQDGDVHLAGRPALLRLRDHDRDDHPVGSGPSQGREERRSDAAADGLVGELVTYERAGWDGGLARAEGGGPAALVTINRRERRNAVDGPTADQLGAAFQRFEADDEARVFVLTGAGPEAFCAGADLKNIESFGPRLDRPEGPLGFTRLTPSKPTIAAISGWCLAGGLELALWCDLRIATADAKLGFPERRWGVPLVDGGTQRLPRIVGMGRALDLILSGRIVGAQEA